MGLARPETKYDYADEDQQQFTRQIRGERRVLCNCMTLSEAILYSVKRLIHENWKGFVRKRSLCNEVPSGKFLGSNGKFENLSGRSMCWPRVEPSASTVRTGKIMVKPCHSVLEPVIKHNTFHIAGAHSSVVVKALCCKPEGRGFDTR
jgi:hypothetical protein